MRRLLALTLALLLAAPLISNAQLGVVPHTFTAGTRIISSEVNTNFSTAYANALNRTGGTMTGTLTARDIAADTGGTRNIGASGTRFATVYSTTVNTTGITCASCSIADAWTFTADPIITTTAPFIHLKESDQGSDLKAWEVGVSGGALNFNTTTDALSTTSTRLTLSRTGGATFTSSVTERGRSIAMGQTVAEAFTAGEWTASGSMTWTVQSGDVVARTYRVIGDTIFTNLQVTTTSVGGTPSTSLRVILPGAFTAQEVVQVPCHIYDNGTYTTGTAITAVGSLIINIQRTDGGNFTASTNNTSIQCAPLVLKVS